MLIPATRITNTLYLSCLQISTCDIKRTELNLNSCDISITYHLFSNTRPSTRAPVTYLKKTAITAGNSANISCAEAHFTVKLPEDSNEATLKKLEDNYDE